MIKRTDYSVGGALSSLNGDSNKGGLTLRRQFGNCPLYVETLAPLFTQAKALRPAFPTKDQGKYQFLSCCCS